MLKTKIPIISLVFALFLAVGVLPENIRAGVPVPQENYGAIAKKFARAISVGHLSQRKLDDGVSAQAWTNLMDSFDFDHSYFLMSDVNSLTNTMFMIDDMVKGGDVSLPYDIYAMFRTRVEERYCFVTNLLTDGFEFKIDEDYEFRRRELPWASDRAEQNDIWRKRIKNEVLAIKLSQELTEENATNQSASVTSTNKPVVTAEENVSKRYKQYMIIIQDMDSESILQRFLSAVAYAYDPHSDYMSPMRKEDFDIDMNLSLCGIGASLRSEDGMARIMEIIPGGPADRDKREIRLTRDDKIIGVGQGDESIESILHIPLNRAVRKIRGEKGTKVVLEVIPASDPSGSTTKIVDLVRDEVKLEEQAATGRVERVSLADGTEQKIGYVRLPTFYATMDKKPGQKGYRSATDDIARYMAKFNSEDVVGMVLDLRNNGGGSLREAISLTGLFIRSGPVVQVREMNRIVVLPVPNNAVAFRKPLAVLINRASASASEIVAGALQDYGRAVVIGDSKSHGKGTVQTVIPLGDDDYGSLKVTTASFYRINGASTQRKGVQSDIVIPSRFEGLEIGEDKMPNALPWTEVAPARYVPVFDMQKFIPELKTMSAERLAANDEYLKYSKLVEHFKEAADRKKLPLHIEKRRELIKSDRALQELEGEITDTEMQSGSPALPPESEAEKIDKAEKGKDLVLNEALLILTDLIRLSGGGDLNMETEGDLTTRIMQIFGGGQ